MDKLLISDWVSLVTALGVVVAMISAIFTLSRAGRKNATEDTKTITEMRTDIKYIKVQVDNMSRLPERLMAVERDLKSAHNRIDGHETRIQKLEEKI